MTLDTELHRWVVELQLGDVLPQKEPRAREQSDVFNTLSAGLHGPRVLFLSASVHSNNNLPQFIREEQCPGLQVVQSPHIASSPTDN